MYQSSAAYPEYSSFPPSSPPTPPPRQYYYHQHHHHHGGGHLYPPSPPQGASPSSDSGSFLSPPASSIPSSYLHRSSSALSLHKHVFDHAGRHHATGGGNNNNSPRGFYEPPDLFDHFQAAGPIRRVFSTGDIQGTDSLQPSSAATENCGQEVGGNGAATATQPGGRVGRYSAEERKERIERYRNKRSQRNFQKKITYACRKTLADSRPRIRGRFARNGETDLEAEAEAGDAGLYGCGSSFLHAGGGGDDCGWAAPPAMDDDEDYPCDPDFWANFFNSLSMNTLVPNGDVMYSNEG